MGLVRRTHSIGIGWGGDEGEKLKSVDEQHIHSQITQDTERSEDTYLWLLGWMDVQSVARYCLVYIQFDECDHLARDTRFSLCKAPQKYRQNMDIFEKKRHAIKIAPKTDRYICLMNFTWVNIYFRAVISIILLYCWDRR